MEIKTKSKKTVGTTKVKKVVKKTKAPIARKWYIIDAKEKIIGRLSSKIATLLLGKNKVTYVPYLDGGDYIVVINASKIVSTGRKEENKVYYNYSGYPGGLKSRTLKTLRVEKPEMIIKRAVSGMLPKNRLGKAVIKKLYVYAGDKHPHENHKFEEVEI